MAARAGSRRVFAFLAGVMLLASTASSAVGQSPDAGRFTATPLEAAGTIVGDFSKAVVRDGKVSVIVKLKDASAASYRGGVNNMKATNPAARGAKTLDFKSNDLTTYRNYLKGKQDAFSARLTSGVKGAKVTGNFDLVLNAVSAVVPSSELATIANMPGVATIYPDSLLKLETDVSPQFIGAPTVWVIARRPGERRRRRHRGRPRHGHLARARLLLRSRSVGQAVCGPARRRLMAYAVCEFTGGGEPGAGVRLQQQAHRRRPLHGHV